MPRLTTTRRTARRGAILVVVLATLTIFAVVGIAFVYYSDGEMVAARYAKEAESRNGQMIPSPPAFDDHAERMLLSVMFGIDPNDPNAPAGATDYKNQLNGFRGHDLLSSIYGAHATDSATPYTGPGIIHESLGTSTWADKSFASLSDRARVINNTVMNIGGKYLAFDPEISGEARDAMTRSPIKTSDAEITGKTPTRFHVAKNAPYTYPDLNNLYLASVSPATGEVVVPSYFRPWAFNDRPVALGTNPPPAAAPIGGRLAGWDPNDKVLIANTDWVTAEGRAKILRPRPIDQLTPGEISGAIGINRPPTETELNKMTFPQWTALHKTIDDKIRSGDIIGYPRPNSDNSTTGDVFSYIGGVGPQRNDTILIDAGFAPFEWPVRSGKYIKPLAALLVTDNDGLLNVNAHGMVRNGGNHTSYHGFGPWEVNLESAAANKGEASTIVSSRFGKWGSPGARNNQPTQTLPFDPSARRLGLYGQVNWDATGTLAMGTRAVTIPSFAAGANPFAVVPNYAAGFFDDNTDPKKGDNHPALYNPADWAAFPESNSLNPLPAGPNPKAPFGFTYSHADTRRLRQRYAGELDLYQQMTFNKLAGAPSGTLVGSFPAGSTYRQDPAHPRRGLFTTLSAGHDLPLTMPQGSETNAFTLTEPNPRPTPTTPQPTAPVHGGTAKLTAATGPGSTPFLGPVNLNRPLADYRKDKTTDLNAGNTDAGTSNQAWADRHNLARDIFIRLVIGTGAISSTKGLDSSGNLKLPQPSSTPEYNGLRYLAQMAANIVDYIDGDDVSTMFVWNSDDSANSPDGLLVRVTDTSVASTATAAMSDPTKVGERVVFGVEVPRLVINEVYSEIVDDPNGKGKGTGKGSGKSMDDGLARFWVELLNPASPVSPAAAKDGVLGTGKVVLKDAGGIKPYKLVIARGNRKKLADDIRYNPANVAGDLPDNKNDADIEYDFNDAGAANSEVAPNNGKYDPAGDPTLGVVVVGPKVTGANPAEEFDPKQLATVPPWANTMIESSGNAPKNGVSKAMEYRLTNAEIKSLDLTKSNSEFRRHVVLLRRLANPYVAEDAATNPYVTVDVMDWVPANDALFTGNGGGMGGGGRPIAQREALGRVQPYAGHAFPDDPDVAGILKYTFPTSATLAQSPMTAGTNEPKHTFGRHNGRDVTAPTAETFTPATPAPTTGLNDTVMAPYDWLVHLDRPLVNQLELLNIQAVKPHEVTYYFLQPPAAAGEGVRKHVGQAPWFGVAPDNVAPQIGGHPFTLQARAAIDTTATGRSTNGLFRGLEFLRPKPWTYGAASGGRVHGKLNLNTIQDIRVWNALADPQAANGFTQADSDKLWTTFFTSPDTGGTNGSGVRTFASQKRTDAISQNWTVPAPGQTIDDLDPNDPNFKTLLPTVDRPFKPFGTVDAGAVKSSLVSPNGSGLQDTIFRADGTLATPTGRPVLWPATATHPYLEAELARKVFNNTTTVSNVFTVHLTIVYHEVRMDTTASPPVLQGETINVETDDDTKTPPVSVTRYFLGRESFREVPGDMRQQYLAVVDRSNALVQPPYPSGTQDLAPTPFHSTLGGNLAITDTKLTLVNAEINTTNASATVYADGVPVTINAGTKLRIGNGPDADWVKVTSVDTKTSEINFEHVTNPKQSALQRSHQAGVVVTNASFGRPVQPTANFSPIKAPDVFRRSGYPLFIPYASRVR